MKNKTMAALASTFTFTANATNKSNEQQVNSSCFEKEPLEKHIAKVTMPGSHWGSDVIDLNWIADD